MIYLTEGNIPLNAAYDDNITQEANSTYQLLFKFPTNNLLWQRLREETFLTADDLHGEQDFVIFEVEKHHGYIQVYANQVMTLLNNYVIGPLALDRVSGSTALSQFAGSITRDNPFSFFSDIEDRHTFNIGPKNAMEAFAKDKHSIIGQWGGDLVRHGYQVRLLKNGGSENESLFMYKKNLSSYQHKTSTKSLKTRITFIAKVKGEGEKAPDRNLSVVVDSQLINKYNQIYEAVIEVNNQDVKDEASLREYGKQYFRTTLCDMLEDSIEIDVIGQSDVPVQMFDVAGVFHEFYNMDVRKKITKYTYSPMAKKLKSIGFGQFQSGLANAIGNVVSDAVKGETQQFQSNFERQLARELKNADLAFEKQKEELINQFTDEVNSIKAKAEENKKKLSDGSKSSTHQVLKKLKLKQRKLYKKLEQMLISLRKRNELLLTTLRI
jgi:phage minor structural protein